MQLLDSDWPANILAGAHFRTQESGLMSPDGSCAISVGPAEHENKILVAATSSSPQTSSRYASASSPET